jgi:peptide/nickel transport system permease protein
MNRKIILKRMLRSHFFMVGLMLAFLVLFIALIAPFFVQYSPIKISLREKLIPPEGFVRGFAGHILGTDQLGRDILTRLLTGGASSLMIAFTAVILQLVFGVVLGIVAGYFGKATDSVIMRMCDVFLAIPNIVLAIAIMSVLGASVFNLIFVLVASGWVRYCKVTRNNVMVVKKQEFVLASRVLGASGWHIMFTQIFPNVTTPLIILASSRVGNAILVEAALSFLNLGIPAPTPSWGNMISDGRSYLAISPWLVFSPGIALMITVLAFNFFGDGLRDVLDPKKS